MEYTNYIAVFKIAELQLAVTSVVVRQQPPSKCHLQSTQFDNRKSRVTIQETANDNEISKGYAHTI